MPPRVNQSPKVPTAKAPIAIVLRHWDRRCQRVRAASSSDVNGSPRRRLRSAPAAARTEVEIVEELRRLGHAIECIACSGRGHEADSRLGPARRRARGAVDRGASERFVERLQPGADRRHGQPRAPRQRRGSTSGQRPPPRHRADRARRSRQSRRPVLRSRRGSRCPWREFEARGGRRPSRSFRWAQLHVVGLNSARPWRHRVRRARRGGARARRRGGWGRGRGGRAAGSRACTIT